MRKRRLASASIALVIPVVMFMVLVVLLAQPVYAANPSMTLSQCAMGQIINGAYENPTCEKQTNTGWINGLVGPSKSSYWLGDFIAYRAVFEDMKTTHRYCVGVNWDVAKAELPAIDYISTYSITLPQADPLIDVPALAGVPAQKFPLSVDPILIPANGFYLAVPGNQFTGTLPFEGTSAPQGHLTVWGAVDPKGKGLFLNDASVPGQSPDLTDATQGSEFCFSPTHSTVVMAWGGHIAKPKEWQAPARPPGAPYHTRTGTGEISATVKFTPPRSGVNDMAEFICNDVSTCDNTTPILSATHYNIGSQDLQLGINQPPTAITLRAVSASGSSNNLAIGLIGIAVLALATAVILVLRRRELSDA